MATSTLQAISVDQSNALGMKEMVQPILAGDFVPLGRVKGKQFQAYLRSCGDWWMNIDGNDLWLKIYEA